MIELADNENFRSVVENPKRRAEFIMRVFPELRVHLLLLGGISDHMEDILKEKNSLFTLFEDKEELLMEVVKNENRFDKLLLTLVYDQIEEMLENFIGYIKIVDDNTFTTNITELILDICRKKQITTEFYLIEDISDIRRMKESILREKQVKVISISREEAESMTDIQLVIQGRKNSSYSGENTLCIKSLPAIKEYYAILYLLMKDSFAVDDILDKEATDIANVIISKNEEVKETLDVTNQVLKMIAKELGVDKSNIELDVELIEYGMNSILMARLYTQLVDRYGSGIEPKEILQSRSVKALVDMIENKQHTENGTLVKVCEVLSDSVEIKRNGFTASSGNYYEYTIDGEGEPLLILTALAFAPTIWEYQKESFRNHYKMILPTLPAHGDNSYQGQKLSFDMIAEDMKEFMTYLNIDSAYMIGWCMAGNILQKIMARYPRLVKKACLVCTTPEDASIRGVNAKDLQDYSKDPLATYELEFMNIYGEDANMAKRIQEYMKLIQHSHCEVDSIALLYYIDDLFKFNIAKDSHHIDIPTLIIAGRWDITYPTEQVALLTKIFKNTDFKVFEHSGHMPFVSESDEFNERVKDFFK